MGIDIREHGGSFGGGGITSTQKQNLVDLTNEAETNDSTMKTNFINSVNNADTSIGLPSTATWSDILQQIPNIKATRKQWKTGLVNITSGNMTISNIGFAPSMIIMMPQSQSVSTSAVLLTAVKTGAYSGVPNGNYIQFDSGSAWDTYTSTAYAQAYDNNNYVTFAPDSITLTNIKFNVNNCFYIVFE